MTAVSDDITTRLRRDCMSLIADEAADTIDRLRAERDEARREVSFLRPCVCLGAQTPHEYAKHRGWDCFGPNTCKEAQHDLEADMHTG
jgi:hypothetical protein